MNDFENCVTCELCGRQMKQITGTHLKKEHGITFSEYKSQFPNCKTLPEDVRKTISEKASQMNKDGKIGFKPGHIVNYGKRPWNKGTHGLQPPPSTKGHTKYDMPSLAEAAKKISKTRKQMFKDGRIARNSGERNPMYGKKLTEAHKIALLSGWKSCKTKPELKLAEFLKEYHDWHYVGNGKFFVRTKIKTRVPDFVNAKQKKIIEVYGDYWHKNDNPQDKIDEYNAVGWDCIVLWEHEIMAEDFNLNSIQCFL